MSAAPRTPCVRVRPGARLRQAVAGAYSCGRLCGVLVIGLRCEGTPQRQLRSGPSPLKPVAVPAEPETISGNTGNCFLLLDGFPPFENHIPSIAKHALPVRMTDSKVTTATLREAVGDRRLVRMTAANVQ